MSEFIRKIEEQSEGEEYRKARKRLACDVNEDGQADYAFLFTLEGMHRSNNYCKARLMAVSIPPAETSPRRLT